MPPSSSSASSASSLGGVLPVFQTPFHEDESIDFKTLDRELDWLLKLGAQGCVIAMVSEVLRLSTTEREKLAEHVCACVGSRGSVVVSVGAESSRVAADLARHAERAGAAALMAIPPLSTMLSDDSLQKYYSRILDAVSLPLVVQDASGYVGRPMSIPLQARILEEYGPRVYFKPEANPIGPRLTALREATGGQARVFEGSGGISLVDSFRRGIVGTMPGAEIVDAIVALWNALIAGDERRVYELSLPISALIAVQTSLDAFLAVEKHLLVRRGIFNTAVVRGPAGYTLDDETRREVDRLFDLVMSALARGSSAT